MNTRSLLVVDDSATFRQLLCMSLQRVGGISKSDISEASNGEEALEKVKSTRFDLVLTDIRMPKMDGLEFVRQVRSELKQEDLPIIIISTRGADEDIELGMSLGASGYLSKPISIPRLKDLVKRLLPQE